MATPDPEKTAQRPTWGADESVSVVGEVYPRPISEVDAARMAEEFERTDALTPLQLDLATVILRIEQIATLEDGEPLRALLINRLATCDVPRLRRYLTVATLNQMRANDDK